MDESDNFMLGEFTYLGSIEQELRYCVNVNLHQNRKLELLSNIDGIDGNHTRTVIKRFCQ